MSKPTTFSEAITRAFTNLMENVHTSIPGKIVTYENRIASVKPMVQRKLSDGTFLDLPIIEEVPVIFPGATNVGLSFPLTEGDPVFILFTERSIEDWFSTGNNSQPQDPRRFSLTDAVAIPGIPYTGSNLPTASGDDLQLTYNNSNVTIKQDGEISIVNENGSLLIKSNGNIEQNGNSKSFVTYTELNTALQGLVTAINAAFGTKLDGGGTPGTLVLDISASQTITIKTGG